MTKTLAYKLPGKDFNGEDLEYIIRKTDGVFVPTNSPGNTSYQEYLEWVAAGNTADAAD